MTRQPIPLPTRPPFLSIYTTYFRRPSAIGRCLMSVGAQTAVDDLEHLVVPDHAGYGVAAGLYGRLAWYQGALRGQYIHLLPDDDALAGDTVVEQVRAFAVKRGFPPVITVNVRKGTTTLPARPASPPAVGEVDLCSFIVRSDIWRRHLADFGMRFEGDGDFAVALHQAGVPFAHLDLLFVVGPQNSGHPEY